MALKEVDVAALQQPVSPPGLPERMLVPVKGADRDGIALKAIGLCKKFDGVTAVDDISFTIPEGKVFCLVGRNGAGKSTTVRMLMNIYLPDAGEVYLRGKRIDYEFNNRVGYLPEERGLYRKMKVLETVLFLAELKGKRGDEVRARAIELLGKFGLGEKLNCRVEELSKGNQQKVQIIGTIIHDPEFVILDEPFSGLDPVNTNVLKEIIQDLKERKKVIILSTHLLDFAEKIADWVVIIDKGKLVANSSMSELKASYGDLHVKLEHEGDVGFLRQHPGVDKLTTFGRNSNILVRSEADIQDLFGMLAANRIRVSKFEVNSISLHDIFVELTAGRDAEPGTSGGDKQ